MSPFTEHWRELAKSRSVLRNWPWCTILWVATICAVVGMFLWLPDRCWDLRVSTEALGYLRQGLDPYQASIAHQKMEEALGHHVFLYWYPPVSIDFLRALNLIPAVLRSLLFWLAYFAGLGLQLWAGAKLVRTSEWKTVRYLLPVAIFFPACLPSDTILSGNIAIPILGVVMFTCVQAWQTQRWTWFYIAVLASSLIKPPMLIWLVVPALVGSAEYLRSSLAGTVGLACFILQKVFYPQSFATFMQSVRYALPLETNYSVSGLFNHSLQNLGRPFPTLSVIFYFLTTIIVLLIIVYFALEFRKGYIAGTSFFTVLVVATALLSPRVKEYDLLPLTIPMCLIILRNRHRRLGQLLFLGSGCTAVLALLLGRDDLASVSIVVAVFLTGIWSLVDESRAGRNIVTEEVAEAEPVGA